MTEAEKNAAINAATIQYMNDKITFEELVKAIKHFGGKKK